MGFQMTRLKKGYNNPLIQSFINNLSKAALSFWPSMVIMGSLYSLHILSIFLYHVNQCRVQIKLLLLLLL